MGCWIRVLDTEGNRQPGGTLSQVFVASWPSYNLNNCILPTSAVVIFSIRFNILHILSKTTLCHKNSYIVFFFLFNTSGCFSAAAQGFLQMQKIYKQGLLAIFSFHITCNTQSSCINSGHHQFFLLRDQNQNNSGPSCLAPCECMVTVLAGKCLHPNCPAQSTYNQCPTAAETLGQGHPQLPIMRQPADLPAAQVPVTETKWGSVRVTFPFDWLISL